MTEARPRALVSWSSGKDSAWALHEARRIGTVEPVGLLTTVTTGYERVSMHGVRRDLLESQARRTGLPLTCVSIPPAATNAAYESAFLEALGAARDRGVTRIVFGDLFLEDVRSYRERLMRGSGIRPEFPLWGRDTRALAREMLDGGLAAVLVCVDPRRVPAALAGRAFDAELLAELPLDVDPCGENGEFHTCVVDGPMFDSPIVVRPGARVERDGFVFADLVPDPAPAGLAAAV